MKNKQIRSRFLLALIACLTWFGAQAQLAVFAEANAALHDPAAPLLFRATASSGTWVSYSIKLADRPEMGVIEQGMVQAQNGEAWISYLPAFPCFVICQVQAGNPNALAASVFQPYQIAASAPAPADFDTFWQEQVALARQTPLDIELTSSGQQPYHSTYKLRFALPGGRHCYGYLCVPVGSGPFPAMIELPAYGFLPNIVQPPNAMAERGGAIALSLNIHDNDPTAAGPSDYVLSGASDPNTNYFKYAILSVVRAIDYLQTRPDFNGQVGIGGVSQGGGLSMLAAGVDERISVLYSAFAAMADHAGGAYNKPSGFPYYYNSGGAALLPSVRYYDAAYAAARFKGASYTVIGYEDEICPPATTMAAYNALQGEKNLLHLLRNKHNPVPEEVANPSHPNGLYAFLRTHLPAMQTPPWPWGDKPTGYRADIDADSNAVQGSPAALKAVISRNGVSVGSTWPCRWTLLSGPGNAVFSQPEGTESSVVFDQAGTYRLRFACIDPAYPGPDKYVSIADECTITVTNSGDVSAPAAVLSTDTTVVFGDFWMQITWNEAVMDFSASDIVTVNCEVLALQGSANAYAALVRPGRLGNMSLRVPANACTDVAGNGNTASGVLQMMRHPILLFLRD
jgi:cephalosporin-C deacetylase